VLGWAEFCGHRVAVAPGVFVPRRRTQWLVRTATVEAPPQPAAVDLCTGSGAVALAVAAAVRPRQLHAVDLDPAAVACARRNLAGIGEVHRGDLFEPLPPRLRGSVDLITVNAPYVPTDRIRLLPPEAREHEPHTALDGGVDGLSVHRRVIEQAPRWLAPGGVLVLEMAEEQTPAAAEAAERAGLRPDVRTSADGEATVLVLTVREPEDLRGRPPAR
jgi:release factor glutamine methyltransferase